MSNKTRNGVVLLSTLLLCIILSGCAVPSGGCPFCGYPPGVRVDGDKILCQRCQGTYRVYLDGSVRTIQRPTQQYEYPVPTNNTDATQRSLNATGQFFMQGLNK